MQELCKTKCKTLQSNACKLLAIKFYMDRYIILCDIALGVLYIIESQIHLCVMVLGGETVVIIMFILECILLEKFCLGLLSGSPVGGP